MTLITTVSDLKDVLRNGDNTDLGGYPLYFITSDGEALSFAAVHENLRLVYEAIKTKAKDGWRVVSVEINYEDHALYCAHTGEPISSAY